MICERTQGFFENANNAYASFGMKGHGGIDVQCGYGSDIECPLDAFVYKVLDKNRKANDGSGYWGIFMIATYKGQLGELCVGHCSEINVEPGQKVKKGQVIGKEGNRGLVFAGGVQITPKMQDAGDKRGAHRHWQFRPITRKKLSEATQPKLTGYPLSVYTDEDGYCYEINSYFDGFHGLSPEIAGILNDFADWKPTPTPTPIPSNDQANLEIIKKQISLIAQIIELLKKIWFYK